jgi:hypothetical protein
MARQLPTSDPLPTLRHLPPRRTMRLSSLSRGLLALLPILMIPTAPVAAPDLPIPLATLGDSDSHSYHDRIWAPKARGGPFAAGTFQWTEALQQMRGQQIDLGPWGVWGARKRWVQALNMVGLDARAPRKEDFRYNFAFAGARCEDLTEGVFRQTPRLIALMDETPARWVEGIVVIRIGINSLGSEPVLNGFAADPTNLVGRNAIDRCVSRIKESIDLIHLRHPRTRIAVIGILNNADWPPLLDRWQSAAAMANIGKGLDAFDTPLRQLAASDPRIAFFDDRAWFAQRWGGRGPDGRPAYKTLSAALPMAVSLTQGDDPRHAVLMDGHAGMVWNAIWAQSLVALLRSEFGVATPAISDTEVAAFVSAALASGKP